MTAQQLKNSILQMAVQGKLVPQDPNDEPASVLLERIRAEKEQLIKEKKIKKEKNPSVIFRGADNLPYEKVGKNEPVCIADEVPFEIPETWEWVHLSDIAISGLGKTLNKSIDNGKDTPYLCSINVYWTGIDLTTVKTAKFTQTDRDKYLLQKGDLLICEGGDVGRSAVWNYDREMYYQNALHRVRFLGKINPYFFLYLLECYKGLKIIEEYSKGVTIKHFVQSSLNAMFLPLPPLNEQQRIVDKINEVMPVVAKYDTTYSKVTELNETFPEALKRSILQWAVQGNLVPQDPADEPAEALLERIRVEKQRLIKEGKIKKDKHESVIFRRDNSHYEKLDGTERCIDNELPFEIPESWCWVRFGTALINRDAERIPLSVAQREKLQKKYDYYGASGVIDKVDQYLFDKPLLLIGEDGANLLLRSKPIAFIASGQYWVNNHAHVIDSVGGVDLRYIALFINAINLAPYVTGTAQPKMNQEKLNSILVPLPPVAEQQRIVTAFEEIVAIIR